MLTLTQHSFNNSTSILVKMRTHFWQNKFVTMAERSCNFMKIVNLLEIFHKIKLITFANFKLPEMIVKLNDCAPLLMFL